MSKKHRKQPKDRRNNHLDQEEDEVDFCRECGDYHDEDGCYIAKPQEIQRPQPAPRSVQKHNFKEGQVVTCPDKRKIKLDGAKHEGITGTIILVYGGEVHVLDTDGVIHSATVSEIYAVQE